MRKVKKIFIMAVVAGFLSGCAESKIEYVENSETVSSEEAASSEEATSEEIEEKLDGTSWIEKIAVKGHFGEEHDVEIRATTHIQTENPMLVVGNEIREYTPDQRRNIVSTLSDGEKIYSYNLKDIPKDILEKNLKFYLEQVDALEDLPFWKDKYEEKLKSIEAVIDKAPTNLLGITDYSCDNYLYYKNDIPYVVSFDKDNVETLYPICPVEDEMLDDTYGYRLMILRDLLDDTKIGEVLEDYSQDQAEEIAVETIKTLGISNPLLMDSYMEKSFINPDDNMYVFLFQQECNYIPDNEYSDIWDSTTEFLEGTEKRKASYRFIRNRIIISVDNRGRLLSINVNNEFEVMEKNTDIQLMKLSDIKNIIRNELIENAEEYVSNEKNRKFFNLKLNMTYIRDDENAKIYLIPCWELKDARAGFDEYSMYINAIDGSIVVPCEKTVEWK